MFWFSRKVDAQPEHSQEWNEGYASGHDAAWCSLFHSMQDTMEFHNAYIQMLEREVGYLRQEMKKYRQDDTYDGNNCGKDAGAH